MGTDTLIDDIYGLVSTKEVASGVDIDKEIEKFDRGWYAGPIGWIGNESTELVVGIRSALVNNNRLLLYSGAGIIESSDADSEYEEIENKLSNYINILT